MKIEFNNQVYEVEKTSAYCTRCIFFMTSRCPRYSSDKKCIFPDNYICKNISYSQLFRL